MKLTIQIEMSNAAFERDPAWEAAEILGKLKERLLFTSIGLGDGFPLLDSNGNHVGNATITE